MRTISRTFLKNYKERVILLEGEKVKLLDEKDKIVIEVSKLKNQVNDLDNKIVKEKIVSQKKDQLITYASKLTSVSYTHLDVYKRQRKYNPEDADNDEKVRNLTKVVVNQIDIISSCLLYTSRCV